MSYEETLERVIQRLDSEEKEKDKRIAELEKKLWRTEQKSEQAVNRAAEMIEHRDGLIAELEKERDELLKRTECTVESFNMEAHNLEQQAKSLFEYSIHLISDAEGIPEGLEHKGRGSNIYNWQTHFARELRYRANKLCNAKEALEQGE